MELLLSNFPPINITPYSARSFVEKNIKECEFLRIATGYISSDALVELRRIIEINHKPQLELLIGMHYFDGFTKSQYEATISLDTFLRNSGLGFVSLCCSMKFHGKMYSFTMNDTSLATIVGSSNLGSIYDKVNRLYEADILLQGTESKKTHEAIVKIIAQIGTPFNEIKITKFNEFNCLFDNHESVKKLSSEELIRVKADINEVKFEIPTKTEPKSNLNAFFGKGRVNQRGYEMPRPWYEVELIVSKTITANTNYPNHKVFTVITDDGWSFKCETNGDFNKNFRSKDDLKILGRWIKGRLEESGALEIGTPVTDSVLQKYGRKSVTLSGTTTPDIWYLDFSI